MIPHGDEFKPKLFLPVVFHQYRKVNVITDIRKYFITKSKEIIVEPDYPGIRVQIHCSKGMH